MFTQKITTHRAWHKYDALSIQPYFTREREVMFMECMLCNKSIGLTRRRISNGYICGSCSRQYPDFIKVKMTEYTDLRLGLIKSYFEENSKRKFEQTAAYGSLSIDEINGVFKVKENSGSYIFDAIDMTEGNILCTNPKVNSSNIVYADVEFYYKMESPHIELRVTINKNRRCQSKKVSGNSLEWQEPADLTMFRNMFNQMLENARKKYDETCRNTLICKADIDYFKAKSLFMVEDDYDEEEIKIIRKKMMKIYHPDNGETDTKKSETINRYYDILMERLKS